MNAPVSSRSALPPYAKLPYDVETDFVPIMPVVKYFYALTGRNGLNAETTKEVILMVKAKPHVFTYGSWGVGSVGHLGMEMLAQAEGLQMLHVPYTGGPAAYNRLSGGASGLRVDARRDRGSVAKERPSQGARRSQ